MTQPEPEAGPAEQDAVRRLLAGARHDEPVPPAVAARLDEVLAGLVAEESPAATSDSSATVVDLDDRRRRRRVTAFLGAAAAVVVLGVGLSQVTDPAVDATSDSSGGSAAVESQADALEAPREDEAEAAPEAADGDGEAFELPDGPAPDSGGVAGGDGSDTDGTETLPTVSPDDFEQSVRALRAAPSVASTGRGLLTATELSDASLFVCPPTELGPGRLLAVSYADQPAVLAFRPPVGETQSVELVQCGSGVVLRSLVLMFP